MPANSVVYCVFLFLICGLHICYVGLVRMVCYFSVLWLVGNVFCGILLVCWFIALCMMFVVLELIYFFVGYCDSVVMILCLLGGLVV